MREREFCGGNIDDAWYGTWHNFVGPLTIFSFPYLSIQNPQNLYLTTLLRFSFFFYFFFFVRFNSMCSLLLLWHVARNCMRAMFSTITTIFLISFFVSCWIDMIPGLSAWALELTLENHRYILSSDVRKYIFYCLLSDLQDIRRNAHMRTSMMPHQAPPSRNECVLDAYIERRRHIAHLLKRC
jgi:hypothetical protein